MPAPELLASAMMSARIALVASPFASLAEPTTVWLAWTLSCWAWLFRESIRLFQSDTAAWSQLVDW